MKVPTFKRGDAAIYVAAAKAIESSALIAPSIAYALTLAPANDESFLRCMHGLDYFFPKERLYSFAIFGPLLTRSEVVLALLLLAAIAEDGA